MESGIELDLAREEATAQQALKSPLGQNLPNRSLAPPEQTSNVQATEQPGRSSRSGSRTTSQPRLKPKAPSDRRSSAASSSAHGGHGGEAGSFELSDNDSERMFRLQPVDEGFGAWSYVASAFAMYIVVWGS